MWLCSYGDPKINITKKMKTLFPILHKYTVLLIYTSILANELILVANDAEKHGKHDCISYSCCI